MKFEVLRLLLAFIWRFGDDAVRNPRRRLGGAARGPPEYVRYEANDGYDIGELLYNAGERPTPAIVDVHGGPGAYASRMFEPRIQFLVAQGYTILRPNFRGSSGRGTAHRLAIEGGMGGIDVINVTTGARWLCKHE